MLEVKNLTKNYGSKRAVDNVSFTMSKGEILGFLGPNGAGKSTTMNMITGYLASTSGEVLVDGINILENPTAAKAKIGYLPEKPPLYMDMSVKEYLGFVFDLKKVKLPKQKHIDEICKLVKIDHVYTRLIRNLSKGYQQRIGIAQALLGNPDLLILDEPTVGLDPKQIIEIRDLITLLGKKQTVILSSHILSEVQAVCNRIIVISDGKLVADGSADTLASSVIHANQLTVSVAGQEDITRKLLEELDNVIKVSRGVEHESGVYEFVLDVESDVDIRRALFFKLAEQQLPIMSLRNSAMSLEDIFLSLTDQGKVKKQKAVTNAADKKEDAQ